MVIWRLQPGCISWLQPKHFRNVKMSYIWGSITYSLEDSSWLIVKILQGMNGDSDWPFQGAGCCCNTTIRNKVKWIWIQQKERNFIKQHYISELLLLKGPTFLTCRFFIPLLWVKFYVRLTKDFLFFFIPLFSCKRHSVFLFSHLFSGGFM